MELNHFVWSRLPLELLLRIIEMTDDDETADIWYKATERSTHTIIREAVLNRVWRVATFDSKHARPATRSRWEEVGPFCRDLSINIDYQDKAYCEAQVELLAPHLQRLKSLALTGYLQSQTLDTVATLPHKDRLQTLIAQSRRYYDAFEESWLATHPNSLQWSRLLPFDNLAVLEVNQLVKGDALELPTFITCQNSLKSLRIEVCQLNGSQNWRDPIRVIESPLVELLYSGYRPEDRSKVQPEILRHMPDSLKTLIIIENVFKLDDIGPNFGVIHAAPSPKYRSLAALEDFHAELCDINLTINLVSWFPHARLRRLRLIGSSGNDSRVVRNFSSFENEINRIIETHQDSLEEVVLSDIWNSSYGFVSAFNARWQGSFSITDLVLGLDCTASMDMYPYHSSPYHSKQLLQSWGTNLQRVRLENSKFRELQEKLVYNVPLANLRILILCPRRKSQKNHFPNDISSFTEGRQAQKVARRLSRRGSVCLRYLAIGLDPFWIVKKRNQHDSEEQTIMHFRHAWGGGWSDNEDEELRIRAEIRAWMSDEDQVFIDEDSRLNAERNFIPEDPSYALTQRWNFAVARRVK